MHILIVDDEPLARSRLRTLLTDDEHQSGEKYQVSEAENAVQALEYLGKMSALHAVDMVLLDIHMPGLDGLALAQRIGQMLVPPAVIFVTAHADHALNAFELDAVDYLTKPVRLQRLQQALAKARRAAPAVSAPPIAELPVSGEEEVLLIQERERIARVPLKQVLYIRYERKYLDIRTTLQNYVMEGSIAEMEKRYGAYFLRVHRSTLVARRAIGALELCGNANGGETWMVRLHGLGERIAVARRQVPAVRAEIGSQ